MSGTTSNGFVGGSGVEDLERKDDFTQLKKFGEDNSNFTKTNKRAPNLGIYYFKHEETDTDQMTQQPKTDNDSTLGETSEEEEELNENSNDAIKMEEDKMEEEITEETNRMDETNRIKEIKENRIPKRKAMSEDTIRRLVLKAEQLVSPEKCRKTETIRKMTRVNKWLRNDKSNDSCDASGEDDLESQASEDYDISTSTIKNLNGSFHSQNTSFSELTPEKNRWCRSCISHLNTATSTPIINNFSISESALHNMNLPPALNRQAVSTTTVINGNNSTSSTVEEQSANVMENSSPIKRKKSKRKTKTMIGKSEPYLVCSATKHRNILSKSCSFSGFSNKLNHSDRAVSSDPPAVPACLYRMYDTSTTSGAESEEEMHKRVVNFKVGSKTSYLQSAEMRDDSPEKSSLNTTEEQSSSLSEQAWDNYQENYLSEPYSESHDSDAARNLLNFGEDYRNFIDSQSDWSAFSDMSPQFKRKQWNPKKPYDLTNEEQYLKQILNDSKNKLNYSEELFKKVKLGLDNHFYTNELDELVSSCDQQLFLINRINDSPEEFKSSSVDKAVISGLLSQWRLLKNKSAKMQEYRVLRKQILEMRHFITSVEMPYNYTNFPYNFPIEDITNEIEACKKLLKIVELQEEKLPTLNMEVHRFTVETQNVDDFFNSTLKSDITELYELFNKVQTITNEKLKQIENLLPEWKTLETRLDQLQKDLVEDEKNINLLDSLLINGNFTDQTATCVRDVAKLLSETTYQQGRHLSDLLSEGSFSDSGISDEGSEQEIGERQGRLSAIRRLVRQLEVNLPTDSTSRMKMREKLIKVEDELKTLQLRCRSLIVRTATCSSSSISQQQKESILRSFMRSKDGDGDPNMDPTASNSWFRGRKFRYSIAFQLLILTFVCLSYLFQPECCDNMNNFKWSISPKLHYEGRPPI